MQVRVLIYSIQYSACLLHSLAATFDEEDVTLSAVDSFNDVAQRYRVWLLLEVTCCTCSQDELAGGDPFDSHHGSYDATLSALESWNTGTDYEDIRLIKI